MVPNACGLVKWRLEIKEKSKLRQILQFGPPLSDFTHLVVPCTCFYKYLPFMSPVPVFDYHMKHNVGMERDKVCGNPTFFVITKLYLMIQMVCLINLLVFEMVSYVHSSIMACI